MTTWTLLAWRQEGRSIIPKVCSMCFLQRALSVSPGGCYSHTHGVWALIVFLVVSEKEPPSPGEGYGSVLFQAWPSGPVYIEPGSGRWPTARVFIQTTSPHLIFRLHCINVLGGPLSLWLKVKQMTRYCICLPCTRMGFPGDASSKEHACRCSRHKRHRFDL